MLAVMATQEGRAMDYAGYERIRVTRSGRILTLTLFNPARMNAVDGRMHHELADIFYDVQEDDSVDLVVLQGEGGAFSAGGDIEWMRDAAAGKIQGPTTVEGKKIIFGLLDLEKPIIAKVRGPAIGLGCTIALFCDVIFASDTARFADPHVKVGVVAGDGGAVIWPQLVGYARAKEYLMTGRRIDAREAERIGLVNRVVPADALEDTVFALAREIAANAPLSHVAHQRSIRAAVHGRPEDRAAVDAAVQAAWASADFREGAAAFLERRPPTFTGH